MAVAITVPTSSGNLQDTAGAGPTRLLGWSVRTGAAVLTIDIREGGSGGKIVASINLAASGGSTEWFGESGVVIASDVVYVTVTGTSTGLVGSIWLA